MDLTRLDIVKEGVTYISINVILKPVSAEEL